MNKRLLSAIIIAVFLILNPIALAQQGAGDTPAWKSLFDDKKQPDEGQGSGKKESLPEARNSTDPTQELQEMKESLRTLRERQADMGAEMTALADQIRKLRGELDTLGGVVKSKTDQPDIQAKFDDLSARIRKLENLIAGSETKAPQKAASVEEKPAKVAPNKEEKPDKAVGTDEEMPEKAIGTADAEKDELKKAYFNAYNDYKSGKYEEAREKFQAFQKQFPNASLANGAQFWIGESYYLEGNFERAILEYEKVIKNYPKGDRVPHAMLKQGLSFLKLNDKTSARILLEKLLVDYPDTHQAEIARSTLSNIK
jgi:tol-pal system protein YbgF